MRASDHRSLSRCLLCRRRVVPSDPTTQQFPKLSLGENLLLVAWALVTQALAAAVIAPTILLVWRYGPDRARVLVRVDLRDVPVDPPIGAAAALDPVERPHMPVRVNEHTQRRDLRVDERKLARVDLL
jgi:hypothetical protein